ncbi:2-C-methyl-D-erythritol 4-phosphate cytidylyltransferase [Floccifex sp.]|uniref:2-C-methyl-D-erythritol 4-phosphate cytidylyltransferase n=1 Tax=Floccifex sp. TaxID=2815810 RepID=UPI002A760C3D|nr:2-C-methyl-D-erythritol 4-phosphate cytidylyltransferase [Floccifex sp.]MDD7281343.1 2-C-methyl-D-erythritol 4-phosphate cytidylyltransferase [Erysipelotrichaceae bacterium]MDY2958193.1 2-C-methyl-D-erythritol 4-phosphate cytidylyltransferase [Floccifex sp.]
MNYSVCIMAAGSGSRSKLNYNKVFYHITDQETVLDRCLSLFKEDNDCKQIIIVCAMDEVEQVQNLYKGENKIEVVTGGATRQDSVYNGVQKVKSPYVFIHDGARPYLKKEQLNSLKQTLEKEDACLLMVPSVDTSKIVVDGYVQETLTRSMVYNAQTPQCFKTELLRSCQEKAKLEGRIGTDDAQLVEWYSDVRVKMVLGDESNIKITHPKDLKKED